MNELLLWQCLCVFSLFLFLSAVALTALAVNQKRYRLLWACVPALCLSYFLEQCFDCRVNGAIFSEGVARLIDRMFSLPVFLPVLFCLLLAVCVLLILLRIRKGEKNRITAASVKEAMDSLPTGILCYAPEARVLLVNRAMQAFCRRAVGGELTDGSAFLKVLREGTLLPGCGRTAVGGETLYRLADGSAWKLSESDAQYENHTVHMVFSSDVTEEYGKTAELRKMEEKVERLGGELRKVNREIVSLTTERETLNAKVRIHDEFGSNLLAIRRVLTRGGTREELTELAESLRRNVSFLKNDTASAVRDEYELLISMAKRLGVTVTVAGELPQGEPNKAIMATAIHECLTNTLRHAHGDRLNVALSGENDVLTAVFTNNGDVPRSAVAERGGLASLRELTEQAGGTMTICVEPAFAITIRLPEEDEYGI